MTHDTLGTILIDKGFTPEAGQVRWYELAGPSPGAQAGPGRHRAHDGGGSCSSHRGKMTWNAEVDPLRPPTR